LLQNGICIILLWRTLKVIPGADLECDKEAICVPWGYNVKGLWEDPVKNFILTIDKVYYPNKEFNSQLRLNGL
jgi:hypothetical protein